MESGGAFTPPDHLPEFCRGVTGHAGPKTHQKMTGPKSSRINRFLMIYGIAMNLRLTRDNSQRIRDVTSHIMN
jgi:hypothetical protein